MSMRTTYGPDIQAQEIAGIGVDEKTKTFSSGIMQETYEGALKGVGVASMGIMFTAGGGGNIPACFTALFICGVGGAAYGAFNYVWHSVDVKPHAILQAESEEKNSNPKFFGKSDTTTLFGVTPRKTVQTIQSEDLNCFQHSRP